MIASWFVSDLILPRTSRRANHHIAAIGSSSTAKARSFVRNNLPSIQPPPTCHGSYAAVFADPNVDVVYIATPHAQHASLCLAAIAAGKHVLCEKAFTLNAREATAVVGAARAKGVFVMEAMWLRFMPLVTAVQDLLHEQKVIGDVRRTFCDFGLNMPLQDLPAESRLKDPKLGAGSLLDIGIYSLHWGLLTLEEPLGRKRAEEPLILAQQVLQDQVDVASSVLLRYPTSGRQGVLTSSMLVKTGRDFCRVEGSLGCMIISGEVASMPDTITVELLGAGESKDMGDKAGDMGPREKKVYKFELPDGGKGFYYEADAVAVDVFSGRTESQIMPLDETVRLMRIFDSIRKVGQAKFPQDDEP